MDSPHLSLTCSRASRRCEGVGVLGDYIIGLSSLHCTFALKQRRALPALAQVMNILNSSYIHTYIRSYIYFSISTFSYSIFSHSTYILMFIQHGTEPESHSSISAFTFAFAFAFASAFTSAHLSPQLQFAERFSSFLESKFPCRLKVSAMRDRTLLRHSQHATISERPNATPLRAKCLIKRFHYHISKLLEVLGYLKPNSDMLLALAPRFALDTPSLSSFQSSSLPC